MGTRGRRTSSWNGRSRTLIVLTLGLSLGLTSVAGGQEASPPGDKPADAVPPAAVDPHDGHAHDDGACTLPGSGNRSEHDEFGRCFTVTGRVGKAPNVGDTIDVTMDVEAAVDRDDAVLSIELSDNLEFVGAPQGMSERRAASLVGPGRADRLEGERDLHPDGSERVVARVRATEPGPATVHLRVVADGPEGRVDSASDDLFLTVGGDGVPAAMGFDTPTLGGERPATPAPPAVVADGPEPGPAPPVEEPPGAQAASAAATSCVTGSWHFLDNTGVTRPNRNYQVQIRNASNGNVLAVGVTGHDGGYNLCFDGNVTSQIRVRFISANSRWRVRNTAAANANYENESVVVAVCNGCTVNRGATQPNNDVHRGMHAYYQINNAWNWVPTGPSNCWDARDTTCRQMIVNWTPTSTDGTYYSPAANDIHLAANDPNSPHTVIHEAGHALMDDVYEDNYPSTPNCNPHTIQGASSAGCAWSEGFAEWLPAMVLNDPFYRWPDGGSLNLETPTWGTAGWGSGDTVEGRVAGAMIDISDAANETPWDRFTEGAPSNQWTTFLDHRSTTFNQFFLTHRAAGGFNTAHTGARASVYQNTIDYAFRDPLGAYAPLVRPTPPTSHHNYSRTTSTNYWSVVAVRPPAGADYDLQLYDDSAQTAYLAGSSFSGDLIDFIAVDSNSGRKPAGTTYPRVTRFAGSGTYRVQSAHGAQTVGVGSSTLPFASSDQVVAVRDLLLSAGVPTAVRVVPQAGQSVDAFLMASSDAATAVRSRGLAASTAISTGTGQPVAFSHTAGTSSWHGLVVTQRSGSGNATVHIDTSAPTGSVQIDGGAPTTHSPNVTLTLNASDPQTGVDLMRVAVDGVVDTEPEEPYTGTKAVTLPPGDGTKTVAVRYRNQAGQWSAPVTSTIQLQSLPDLRVPQLTDPPANVLQGGSFEVTDRTRNFGDAAAGNSRTRFYLTSQKNHAGASRRLSGVRQIPVLAPGAASNGTTTVTVPANHDPGLFWLAACADDTNLVTESNEANNCRWSTTRVRVNPAEPDLQVTALADPPATASPGGVFTVTDTTRNRGTGPAGASRTRYWLTEERNLTSPSRILGGARQVPTLAPGTEDEGSREVTIPNNVAAGRYWLMACADATGLVTESNEDNNCRWSATRIRIL